MNILKKALVLPKINISKGFLFNLHDLYINKHNDLNLIYLNEKLNISNNKNNLNLDVLDMVFYNIFNIKEIYSNIKKSDSIEKRQKLIYKSVKFRKIIGVRLEAKGRLTRRLTASRAIFKLRYKGNLKNIDTLNNLSSVKMRGYLKSNLDYTNINSKTRNGCFGLKG